MTIDQIKGLIKEAADEHGLSFSLLASIVEQESSFLIWAFNPEPKYRWVWDVRGRHPFRRLNINEVSSPTPPKDFTTLAGDKDQEWQAQRTSWGLCQIMGAVARENGFSGLYLTELLDPKINLHYGCLHFKRKLRQAKGDIRQALLLWNGGGNKLYPQEVLNREAKFALEAQTNPLGVSNHADNP